MTEIGLLEIEIAELKTEILKFQSRLKELNQDYHSDININSSKSIVENLEAIANVAIERSRESDFTTEAITILSEQLQLKLSKLDELKKQQQRYEWEQELSQLEPELLTLCSEINQLSNQMEVFCAKYEEKALAYNRVSSQLQRQLVCPVSMNVSGVPSACTQDNGKFNLEVSMRGLGSKVDFQQRPKAYIPTPTYSTPILERIAFQKDLITNLQSALNQLPRWDSERRHVYADQIREAERQIEILQEQEVTA